LLCARLAHFSAHIVERCPATVLVQKQIPHGVVCAPKPRILFHKAPVVRQGGGSVKQLLKQHRRDNDGKHEHKLKQ
jgi:hypothetical protein